MRAAKLQSRTKSLHVTPTLQADRASDLLGELHNQEELGDLLYELVRLARSRGWDAEGSLRSAVRRRIDVIKDIEGAKERELGY